MSTYEIVSAEGLPAGSGLRVLRLDTMGAMPSVIVKDMLGWIQDEDCPARAYIADFIGDVSSAIDLLEREVARRTDKSERALAALKRKGLHADRASGLRELMAKKKPWPMSTTFDSLLDMACGLYGIEDWDCSLTDKTWLYAIETVMIHRHPDVYYDHASTMQWGLMVEREYPMIWMLAYVFGYARSMTNLARRNEAAVDRANDVLSSQADMQTRIDRGASELAAMGTKLSEAADRHREELKAKDARIRELEAMCRKLERERDILIQSAEEAEALSDEPGDAFVPDAGATEAQEVLPDVSGIVLPETGVLFVGGHQTLQAKLRAEHPKWKFLTTRMSYKILDDNLSTKAVFVYAGHLSHKLYDKVKRSCPDTPMFYVNSSNLEKLDTEMRLAWAGLSTQESEGDAAT